MIHPMRGEIWWASSGTKRRPVVVISADVMNERLVKVIAIPGTSNVRGWPDELVLDHAALPDRTAFCCREIGPISIADFVNRAGRVTDDWLKTACSVIASVLDCR
jgi:mRNA-degrading endonuclease toxin of MazEF toxin-antitoxin module